MDRCEQILNRFYKRTCSVCECIDTPIAIELPLDTWCAVLQVIAYAYKASKEDKCDENDIRGTSLSVMRDVFTGTKKFTKDFFTCSKCGTVVHFPVTIPLDERRTAMAQQLRCSDCVELDEGGE